MPGRQWRLDAGGLGGITLFATAADSLLHAALVTAALLALPILAVALVVGVVIGLLQALTQIQEMTLTFLPKLLAIALLFVVAGPWWLQTLTMFASVAWQQAGLLRP
jgi:flagellar biosynthetic protein FliQ